VVLDPERIQALLAQALAAARPSRAQAGALQLQHLALLQAYTEAALPAGGLALGSDGRPRDAELLQRQAAALAHNGEAAERLMSKLRRSRPMDLRLAEALLWGLRALLQQPGLDLEHLGAVEAASHAALQRQIQAIKSSRDGIAHDILQAFIARSREAAATAVALTHYRRHYGQLRLCADAHGVQRLHLEQVNRYRPVSLVPFMARHRLRMAAEWHHWARTPAAELRLWRLDSQGRRGTERRVALHKALHDGLVVTAPDPAQEPDLEHGLPLHDDQGRPCPYEVEWRLQLVLNAADRDMLVNYAPLVQPEIEVEAAALRHFEVQVGDSPGLRRTATGWRLDRTLLPREVLAVRLRWRGLSDADALTLSPTGEWRQR